jgi:ferric-dicitrate binding protein FerR (iron transport regulator)
MSSQEGPPFNQQLYEEAAAWLVEFRSGDIDAKGRADFYRWLRLSPEHMRAYLELAAIWNEGSALDRAQHMPDLALLEWSQPQVNVIPLVASHAERSHEPQDAHRSRRTQRRITITSRGLTRFAAAVLLAGAGASLWYWHAVRGVYATGIGEQRLITLGESPGKWSRSTSRPPLCTSANVCGKRSRPTPFWGYLVP